MKRLLTGLTMTICCYSTTFAAVFDTGITCPPVFPAFSLSQINKSSPGYYVVQSSGNSTSLIVLFVKADTATQAKLRADAIYSSSLGPYWGEGKIFSQNKHYVMYYCPYYSAKYKLSSENMKEMRQNPQEAADYVIFKNKD